MTTTEKVIKNKLGLLELSQQLGNSYLPEECAPSGSGMTWRPSRNA